MHEFLHAWREKEFVVGLYLEHATRLRSHVLTGSSFDSSARETIVNKLFLPKYVWVAELSTLSRMSGAATSARVVAEVLIDPTQARNAWSILYVRLPGILFWRQNMREEDEQGGDYKAQRTFTGPRQQWTYRNIIDDAQ